MLQLHGRDAANNLLCLLLHCDAFGEVPWAVNIFAFADGDVVGEQLQRDAGDEGLEAFERVGQGDDVVGKPLYLRVAFSDDCRDSSASRPHLLDVRDDLLVETSRVAMTKTGISLSMRAMGPCFISAAG